MDRMEFRTALAAVLGVGLGLLIVAYPEAVVRVQTAGRLPHDRGGEYGQDADLPRRWRLLVRGLGLAVVAFGLYLAAPALV